jgi:hypothetical protein
MELALKHNPALTPYQEQTESVRRCVTVLESALVKQADDVARELLLEEPHTAPIPTTKARKKSGNKLHKKQQKVNASVKNNSNSVRAESIPALGKQDERASLLHVQKLHDGKLAVVVKGNLADDSTRIQVEPTAKTTTTTTMVPSATDLLGQQRFYTASTRTTNADAEVIMNALCLDVSMLLYTPHGMALHLSAAQLDAVENILQEQLRAVEEARHIHQRMHENALASATSEKGKSNECNYLLSLDEIGPDNPNRASRRIPETAPCKI